MPDSVALEGDERFLVLAPTGRDAQLTCALLKRAGFASSPCADMSELCQRVEQEGAAGLLIAEEVLVLSALQQLCQMLLRQEAWSDIPIVLFTGEKATVDARPPTPQLLAPLGNVTLLDRPLRPITMVSAARAGLRARHRQYTARSELKRQQRAVEQRDQFLAMLGHELRNPLSAILMAASAMCGDDGAKPKYLEILRRQATHLARLVDDLLDVSRVTSGRIVLKCVSLDIGELLKRCLQVTGAAAAAQKVEVRLDPAIGKLIVDGDPVRLEQVFVNLVSNAVKYTPSGGRVDISAARDSGHHVVIKIRDNGVGIAADMLPRIFEMFVQVERTIDRAKGGLGIGLTLVRSLVELHHGSVSAASDGVGKGSEFSVRLPLHVANLSETTSPTAAVRPAPGSRPSFDILIVEDNADSREILQIILERDGHRVDAVADGLAGVEHALASRPELMVVDLGLPGLDGFGVARRVREALGRDVYLIALTGYGQPEDRRRALEAGFDAHLTKPVDIDAISGVLAVARK